MAYGLFGLSLFTSMAGMKYRLISLFTLTCISVAGCSLSSRIKPLTVPAAAQVTRITVIEGSSTSPSTILEPNQIASVIDFFAKHNDGWRTPADTFPTGRYAVNVYNNDQLLMVVWLGPGWIGGSDANPMAPDNRLRTLSADEQRKIETLLRINGQAE